MNNYQSWGLTQQYLIHKFISLWK